MRWLEAELPGARAAFSTRLGGVSAEPYASLDLAILTGDDHGAVRENRRRLAEALGLEPQRVVIARQVHGARIARVDGPQEPSPFAHPGIVDPPERDGHVLDEPKLAGLAFVADCLPVALAGEGGVAMLHCGWRGLVGGIVERGVEQVAAAAAAIGPGIGPCCYEVGEEVLAAFGDLDGVAQGRMLDLKAVARAKLEAGGAGEVHDVGLCTSCRPDLFFSHRRDAGVTGRQAGVVWLEPST